MQAALMPGLVSPFRGKFLPETMNGLFLTVPRSLFPVPFSVKEAIYPVANPKTLEAFIKEYQSSGPTYHQRVYTVMRASYLHHYRRLVPQILDTLEFRSNNDMHRPVISALELLKKYQDSSQRYYSSSDPLYIKGVLTHRLAGSDCRSRCGW